MDPNQQSNSARSSVLDQCRSFLPQLKEANEELHNSGGKHDLQDLSNDENYIEMDLALGVLEGQSAKQHDLEEASSNAEEDNDEVEGNSLEHLLNIYHQQIQGPLDNETTLTDFLGEKLSKAAQADLEQKPEESSESDIREVETKTTKKL
ncbi:client-loading PAQosome cofactor [Schizosaccharomyces osmophilus]|uniref:Client-loading PAQosome cofactor n=1 Tax=Schizosaccharomyces osmophilus TaxID=2545709 RepID=A0AAE9W757_9SCHI|nr:client-loading PAQosome cofactor [Schizosaccharomyces osmophilus]WBW70783.1 client-loading PAQosome cofactor [Schizosaccharomyces osmophilus]